MRTRLLLLPLAALALVGAGCGSDDDSDSGGSGGSGSSGGGKVALIVYSTPQEAYEEIVPAFGETPEGEGVEFTQSYGPSGDQARAVIAGQPADLLALSLAPDVEKVVDEGLVAKDWDKDPYDGNVTRSVVSFVVRKGNPKNIRTWDDLLEPGVKVLIPNVFTSGGAKWDVMAAYGAAEKAGQDPREYLRRMYANVEVQPKSAREALQTFASGQGDVLLSYENEAITAQQKGQEVDYVTPDDTILIENPVAVTTKSSAAAKRFLKYLRSKPAQEVFAEKGYRPVLEGIKEYPEPSGLFTIADVGGWSKANDELFDAEKGFLAGVFEERGVPTDG